MSGQEAARQAVVLERPAPSEEEPHCKVCGQPLANWRPGMPLICDDHNPNRRPPLRNGQEKPSALLDEWIKRTLWYVAAP